MKVTAIHLGLINLVLQVDKEGKAKTYSLPDLTIASDIFKEIKTCVKGEQFINGEIELTSEQKVFLTKLIDDREWSVADAETVFELKTLLK